MNHPTTGLQRVSKCPEWARELEFCGFQRDHVGAEVLEAKKGHIGEERGDGRGWYGGSRGK